MVRSSEVIKYFIVFFTTNIAYCQDYIGNLGVIVYESKPIINTFRISVSIYPEDCWYVGKIGNSYLTYGNYKIINDSLYVCSKNSVSNDTTYIYLMPNSFKLKDNMLIYSDSVASTENAFSKQFYYCDTLYQVYPAITFDKQKKKKQKCFYWYDCVR